MNLEAEKEQQEYERWESIRDAISYLKKREANLHPLDRHIGEELEHLLSFFGL